MKASKIERAIYAWNRLFGWLNSAIPLGQIDRDHGIKLMIILEDILPIIKEHPEYRKEAMNGWEEVHSDWQTKFEELFKEAFNEDQLEMYKRRILSKRPENYPGKIAEIPEPFADWF